jgi:hypothetical protein
MRRIIINADDLGLCPSVNTAIFDVFRAGNLSSATLMVNMPGTLDAVRRSKDHPGLAVGLHFCITEGRSLVGPSSLTDARSVFRDRGSLLKGTLTGKVRKADIRAELEAQLARMAELGMRPTHLDSHQHVHMIPGVFEAIRPVLERMGSPIRVVAPPAGTMASSMTRPVKALKQWVNTRFAKHIKGRTGSPMNDVLVSIHDLESSGPYDARTYVDLVERTPPDSVVEVMVHPYILGPDVLELYADVLPVKQPFLQRCAEEYKALTGPPVFGSTALFDFSDLR